jgi:hypothetical protein
VGFPPRELRDLQLRVRAEQQTPEWKTRYAVRSGVESTVAALRTARMDAAIRESTRVVAEDLGVAPESVGPRMVAVAATAIIIELFTGTQESDLEQAAGVALRLIEAAIDSLSRETPSACTMQPVLRPERLHPTNTVCPDNLATDTTDG